jgi:hypothetical protein
MTANNGCTKCTTRREPWLDCLNGCKGGRGVWVLGTGIAAQ